MISPSKFASNDTQKRCVYHFCRRLRTWRMRRTLAVRRVTGVVHAHTHALYAIARVSRSSERRQWRQMYASRYGRMAIFTTRTYALLYRSAPPSEFLLASFFLSFARDSVSFRLCVSAPLHFSLLCVVSAFCSASVLLRLCLCVRLVCASPQPLARRVRLKHFYCRCFLDKLTSCYLAAIGQIFHKALQSII